jgi:hypothetical protein
MKRKETGSKNYMVSWKLIEVAYMKRKETGSEDQ